MSTADAYILADAARAKGHANTMAEIREHNETKKDRAAWRAYAISLKGTVDALTQTEDDLIAALRSVMPEHPLASREAFDKVAEDRFRSVPFDETLAIATEGHKKFLK